jgi:hypothetical protein
MPAAPARPEDTPEELADLYEGEERPEYQWPNPPEFDRDGELMLPW